ncbi:hypothetical protein BDV18DRAFT_146794 [Aspergillus unguis]
MAKQRPPVSLEQMEDALGYKISVPKDVKHIRFYSDLTAVSPNVYERTRREFDEHLKMKRSCHVAMKNEQQILQADIRYITTTDRCAVVLEDMDAIERYSFTADIYCDFDFHLPLQLTKDEASEAMFVAKLPHGNTYGLPPRFFQLPREVRDEIYTRAIPRVDLQAVGSGDFCGIEFARATGDPTGFYFPFRSELGVLAANRQMREETLPLAYRKASIYLDDMDNFIRFAVSIGEVGRENVEDIGFTWESPSDTECGEEENLTAESGGIRLPTLHSMRCVQLLRGFVRLKRLRLYFEDDLLSALTVADFKADQGICGLRSLRKIHEIEFLNQSGEPVDQYQSIRWIKGEIDLAKHKDGAANRSVGGSDRGKGRTT